MLQELTKARPNHDFFQDDTVNLQGCEIVLNEEVDSLIVSAKARTLQRIYDRHDALFATMPSFGWESSATGVGITIETTYLGQTVSISGPGFIEPPEGSLFTDICAYKESFVAHCAEEKYPDALRDFRSYIACSVSLMDCVLHRYIRYAQYKALSLVGSPDFAVLNSNTNLDERILAWFRLFVGTEKQVKGSSEGQQFWAIKDFRNDFVHPKGIGLKYGFDEMIEYFNKSIRGLGGLLYKMHTEAGFGGYLSFIQVLRNQGQMAREKV